MNQTVLVVEDHDDLRDEVALVLKTEQYNVLSAANGRQALDLIAQYDWRPDLIVSDIAMPVMDGYEFFMEVHASPTLRTTPFIFLTARGTRRDVHIGRQLGVDDYLVKPFEPEELLTAVHNKLQRGAELRAKAERELDDDRRELVQMVSHELRTPLTYIQGGFSLLTDELNQSLTADAAISLDLIRSGTLRLNRLAVQMVLYTELISDHVRLQLEAAGGPVNVEHWVNSSLSMLHNVASERNVTLSLAELPDEPLNVFGLNHLLSSGLSEIVRNGIAHSDEGGHVEVHVRRDGGDAVVQVIDHGHGISPADLEKIWKILSQSGRHDREQQGMGMGLPIAQLVFQAHDGQVTLESVEHKGTTVTVRVPLC